MVSLRRRGHVYRDMPPGKMLHFDTGFLGPSSLSFALGLKAIKHLEVLLGE